MAEHIIPIIPKISLETLLEIKPIDDFTSIEFKCLGYTSGNISIIELFHIDITVALFRPLWIMEFGTFNGRTTLNMALNAPNANIVTVDLPRNQVNRTKYPLESKGTNSEENDETGYVGVKRKLWQGQDPSVVSRITQVWSDTAKLSIGKYENKFDFVFVDASHSEENCRNDSETAERIIKDHGIIYWHDYGGWPGVTKALNGYYEDAGKPNNMFWFNNTSIVGRFF